MPDGIECIAEIGVNHDGNLEKGRRLVDAAKEAGADTVKFQASVPSEEISRRYANGDFDLISRVILGHDKLNALIDYTSSLGSLSWLCTPAEPKSLSWLAGAGATRIKISSDNLTNLPFLRDVAALRLPVILSTGMATLEEIGAALYLLMGYLPPSMITVLHCTSAYPCPVADANLNAITTLRKVLPEMMAVGWSDHTTSMALPVVAVALGATMIEKHLTLDCKGQGPDHAASLEPHEFRTMVRLIKETKSALGDGIKVPRPSETQCVQNSRKSIVAARAIASGEKFDMDNLAVKRPGTGRSPLGFFDLLNQRASRDYEQDEMIV